MSEHIANPNHHETKHAHIDTAAESQRNLERLQKQAESQEHTPTQEVEHLRKEVHTAAKESSETKVGHGHHRVQPMHDAAMHHQLKATAYTRTLHRIQTHLNPRERSLSRFIHRPGIEKASNIGAQTVARPIGILVGSVFALIGSSLLLYLSKQYGFRYNFLFAGALFIAGFALGLFVELVSRPFIAKKRRYSN